MCHKKQIIKSLKNLTLILIGFEFLKENVKYLFNGTIDFLVCDKPKEQAYRGIQILFQSLVSEVNTEKVNLMPIDILKYGGRLGPWAQKRYMPLFLDKYNQDGGKTPFDFDEIIATFAPRPFFSNSPLYDANFDVNGVKKGIENASKVYHLFKAEGNLQVHYPGSGHDFPTEVRLKAYRFIDKILRHTPSVDEIK